MNKNKLIIGVSVVALIFLAAILTLAFKSAFKFKGNGIVNNELIPVNVTLSGVMRDIYVQPEQNVSRGQLIAEVAVKEPVKPKKISKPDVNTAKARLNEAEENYKNFALMYKDGVVSQEDYDKSLDSLTTAQKAYKNAVNQAKAVSSTANNAKEEVVIKKVYSPRDGVVNTNYLVRGEEVKANQPLLLLQLNTPKVTAYVNEKEAGEIKPGQNVKIKVHTFKDKTFNGKVELVSKETFKIPGYKEQMHIVYIGFVDASSFAFQPRQPVSVSFKK